LFPTLLLNKSAEDDDGGALVAAGLMEGFAAGNDEVVELNRSAAEVTLMSGFCLIGVVVAEAD